MSAVFIHNLNLIYLMYSYASVLSLNILAPSSTILQLSAVADSDSIQVIWSMPVMNDLNGVPTHYTLRYSGIEFQTTEKIIQINYTSSSDNVTTSLSGLEAATVYDISVSLSTMIGEGPKSSLQIRTLETGENIFYFFLCLLFASNI